MILNRTKYIKISVIVLLIYISNICKLVTISQRLS